MPALNFLPLPRVSHPKPPSQTDGLPTLPGPCPRRGDEDSDIGELVPLAVPARRGAALGHASAEIIFRVVWAFIVPPNVRVVGLKLGADHSCSRTMPRALAVLKCRMQA